MNNYQKIKKLLEHGWDVRPDNEDWKFIGMTESENLITNCGTFWYEDDFKRANIQTLTPIPRISKEIKGRCDIPDNPEVREFCKGNESKLAMVGQKGLKINGRNIYGDYKIYTKNEHVIFSFPSWAVAPHIPDEEGVKEITITEEMLGKKIKIVE